MCRRRMTGTELKIVLPAETEVLGPEVDRLPTLHTNARTDADLLTVWLKSHADGSAHTQRAYQRVGARFLEALHAAGADLRRWRTCKPRWRPCAQRPMARP
jgi:hypothetical protein